ncbi:sorting nexin-24-like [Ruditapes philippinarum]|uniref:sorting nexin-24-like n=1 Tax=Ruditapes philippinarum TaxID=129788 RepID=UPI00295BB6EC|nr:sorting nexin-24-like [Ruditapes philippinarum]
MIRVSIPSYQKVEGNGDSYTAYRVDVFQSGSCHTLQKRYSEFEELHKQLKKLIETPEFPPKKVLKFNQKIVEQRRVLLEAYLQGVLEGETIPRSFLKFLEVNLPRSGSFDSLDVGLSEPAVSHQPMVGFIKDSFLQENYRSILPDIVSQGVQNGLYSFHQEDYLGLVR